MTLTATKIDSSHESGKNFITWAWPVSTTIIYNNYSPCRNVAKTLFISFISFISRKICTSACAFCSRFSLEGLSLQLDARLRTAVRQLANTLTVREFSKWIVPGDQEGLFKLAIQLRTCFYSATYNTATGYVLWVYLIDI
jgi:hypothetical protein